MHMKKTITLMSTNTSPLISSSNAFMHYKPELEDNRRKKIPYDIDILSTDISKISAHYIDTI